MKNKRAMSKSENTEKLTQEGEKLTSKDIDEIYSLFFPKKDINMIDRTRGFIKNNIFEIIMSSISISVIILTFIIKAVLISINTDLPSWSEFPIYLGMALPAVGIIFASIIRIFYRAFTVRGFLKMSLKETYHKEASLIKQLMNFGDKKLLELRNHFDRELSWTEHRFGFLVGSIDKLGLFPLIISTTYSIIDHVSKYSGKIDTIDAIIIGIVLSYLISIPLSNRVERLKNIISLLDDAVANLTTPSSLLPVKPAKA